MLTPSESISCIWMAQPVAPSGRKISIYALIFEEGEGILIQSDQEKSFKSATLVNIYSSIFSNTIHPMISLTYPPLSLRT